MNNITLRLYLIILFLIITITLLRSQPVADSVYYNRLFYLCKAWGHAKYYHTEIAAGKINWDDELFPAIHGAKYSPTNLEFNDTLQMMLDHAGPMGKSTDTLPYVPDSLNNILDYSWIQGGIFSDSVRAILDTIRSRFRPQPNVFVGVAFPSLNPTFDNDMQYCFESDYPVEEKRLLALFRSWNIFNYFAPNKNLIDQDWDTTLVEFIPKIIESTDPLSYSLALKEFSTRINDSHGYFTSPAFDSWFGSDYPPFLVRFIENETVVTKVLNGINGISPGDVIKAIDGADIYELRDSLRKYAFGSNDVSIESELNNIIMWGPESHSTVVLYDGTSTDTVDFSRSYINHYNLNTSNAPIWYDTLVDGTCRFGIVDMGRLELSQVSKMFSDLWETNAIVFDIRNYPRGTLGEIINYLFPDPVNIANFTLPDIHYPGTMYWYYDWTGPGNAQTYNGKLLILFDERTISQAEYTCMGLEQHPGAIKIGSTTAAADGNVSGVLSPGNICFPFTGLGVFYPDYTPTQRIGIIPDYEVLPTIAGIRAGIDEVLAFALDCSWLDAGELKADKSARLYPNPFLDKLYYEVTGVDHQLIRFDIIDIFGRTVARFDKYSGKGEIDLPGIASGVYLVRMSRDMEVTVTKFIKQ